MNCRERQEFFSDLYDGNLPPDRRHDLESHLSACGDCRSEYETFSSSLHALREAASPVPGEAFVRRVVESARGESERQALFQNTGMRRPTTRRMTAPRRAVWALPALAASTLVAFALGFMIQKHSADQEIEALQKRIAENGTQTPVQPSDPKDPGETPDQAVARFLKQNNLVKVDGAWMSADVADHFARGEMRIDGKWVPVNEEVARRVQDELAKAPGAPDLAAAEQRVMEKLDLVRRGEQVIPRKWAEAFDRGLYLDKDGEPRDLTDIVGDKVRELGLVQHDGQWMRPEERAELLAARRIERFGAGPATVVSRALEGLQIGPPLGFRNLMLYPLIATGERAVAVTTLPEAVAADKVEITDDVNALQVRVKNKGDADLAVLAGEILLGGRHARVVARDTIIPGKKDRTVEVFDVEPAELRAADKTAFRRESGHYWAPLGMRRLLSDEGGQAAVWGAILANGGRASTADLYREHRPALIEFRTALFGLRAHHPGMVGVAVAVGDSIASAEVFGSPALFAAHFDRILESAAIEAIVNHQRETRFPSDLPAGPLSVKRLAESAFGAELDDEGDSVVLRRNGRILGRVLTSGNEAVRVLLFPDGPAASRPALDLAVAPAKVQHLLKAYDARLQAPNTPPQRKTAVIREMAMLPGDHARLAVLDKAKPQAPYRRDAIEALGLRGDPAAGDQLLKWLKESRKDVPTYSVLAQALARLGSEDAIHVLIGDLDPKAPGLARVAAEQLPALMATLKNENTLVTAMGSLIAALNRFPAEKDSDPQSTPWPLKTLRLVTGKSFVGTFDYTIWWNDAANRQDFLEQRKRP